MFTGGIDNNPAMNVVQFLGVQPSEESAPLKLNPLLERILIDFNDGLLKVTKRSFKSDSKKGLVDICIGTKGKLLTRAEEKVLANIFVHLGNIEFEDGSEYGGERSVYDFIAMRRDLSVGLMMITILANLPSEETPFARSEKPFSKLKIPCFVIRPTYYNNGIYITEYHTRGKDGKVYYQDNSVTVNEDGITLTPLVGVFSNEGSEYPTSQFIFENMDTFIQWCQENKIIEKYRQLEVKVSALLRQAWLKNLSQYAEYRD